MAALVIALIAGGFVAASVRTAHDAAADVATSRRELRRVEAELQHLQTRLTADQASAAGTTDRIVALEAKVHEQPDAAAVAEAAKASVVLVEVGDGSGSAWVVSTGGGVSTLVTNYHVVHDDWIRDRKSVKLRRGDATWDGTVTAVSEGSDLALIQTSNEFPALARAKGEPKPGDSVLAMGAPLGLEGTVSSGIVSSVRTEEGRRLIQFSAPISPGSSGGPVINLHGEVVGVTQFKAVARGAEGLNFAIPVNELCITLLPC